MTKEKLEEIHYRRFYEVVEENKSNIWELKGLLEKVNLMLPSNIELTKNGLIALIKKQQRFNKFKCKKERLGKGVTYYIFRKGILQ